MIGLCFAKAESGAAVFGDGKELHGLEKQWFSRVWLSNGEVARDKVTSRNGKVRFRFVKRWHSKELSSNVWRW